MQAATHLDSATRAPFGFLRFRLGQGLPLEWGVAIALTIFLVACHLLRMERAGGLWRDEANSVYLASHASIQENWAKMQFDSFPVAWFAVLRAWNIVGLGGSDLGWRMLGLAVGVTNLLLIWVAGRIMSTRQSGRAPLVALFLVGFCPVTATLGDAIRGYGLGMCCTLAALLSTWNAVRRNRVGSWYAVAGLYTLAVHVSFQTSMAIFAIGCAAAVVGLKRRSLWQFAAPLCAGAAAAATLTLYIPVFQDVRKWDYILRQPLTFGILCRNWIDALQLVGSNDWPGTAPLTIAQRVMAVAMWLGFAGVGWGLAWQRWRRSQRAVGKLPSPAGPPCPAPVQHEGDLLLFTSVALVIFMPTYLAGLYAFGWMPTTRHYLVAIVLSGVLIDCLVRAASENSRLTRSCVAVVTALLAFLTGSAVLKGVMIRSTNVDLAAKVINDRIKPGDVVLVAPWEVGVSFTRYCKPGVKWFTLPPLEDNSVHRYDLYRDVLTDAAYGEQTCRFLRGETSNLGDVWYVGSDLRLTAAGGKGSLSISGGPFSVHALTCLGSTFSNIEILPPLTTQTVSESENVSIILLSR